MSIGPLPIYTTYNPMIKATVLRQEATDTTENIISIKINMYYLCKKKAVTWIITPNPCRNRSSIEKSTSELLKFSGGSAYI